MNLTLQSKNRIHELDALRGIALFGILLVNIFIFHAPYSYYGEFYGSFEGIQGNTVEAVVNFAGGKFLFIFAFLFGYGIAMQKQAYGIAFKSYHLKRMFVLLLFGILHIVLFWFGDILTSYALLGLLLMLIVRLPDKVILSLGLFFLLFRPLYYVALVSLDWQLLEMGKPAEFEEFILTFQKGNYLEILLLRMKEFYEFLPENLVWYIPKTFGLFLIGFYCRNKNFIALIRQKPKRYLVSFISLIILSVSWISLKSNFFAQFDLELNPFMRPVLISINVIFETAQGMAYIIGLVMLFQNNKVLSKPFASTGRLALTNYIMQSLVCVVIFYSYGLGYYGKLLPTDLVSIAIAIFIFNVLFSQLYLKFYKQGPLEYIWREILNNKTFSIKK